MLSGNFGEVVEELRRFTVRVRVSRRGRIEIGSGSGVIWSQDGQIVTNAHVVEGAGGSSGAGGSRNVEVELWDGRRLPGTIAKRDRRRDVAVLQVEASGLPAAACGDSNALRVGELVIAVGNPLGFSGAASTGVVHNLKGGFEDRWVVSQLRLAPGNSGGPLGNARGEVVGINTMIAGGLAFSIPSVDVAAFLGAPLGASLGTPARLGVVVEPVLLDRARRQLGLVVLEVIPGSAAERASLLQGDILVGAGGARFRSTQDLEMGIHAAPEGILELQFRRGASENIRTVTARLAPTLMQAA
jgi:serine protease Do